MHRRICAPHTHTHTHTHVASRSSKLAIRSSGAHRPQTLAPPTSSATFPLLALPAGWLVRGRVGSSSAWLTARTFGHGRPLSSASICRPRVHVHVYTVTCQTPTSVITRGSAHVDRERARARAQPRESDLIAERERPDRARAQPRERDLT
jgi:hypothetical protein